MPAPTMTPEQRAAALEKARIVRAKRSEITNKLSMGLTTPAEVLDQIDDPVIGRRPRSSWRSWAFRPSVVCRAWAPTR